jgi:hypothetical protein
VVVGSLLGFVTGSKEGERRALWSKVSKEGKDEAALEYCKGETWDT